MGTLRMGKYRTRAHLQQRMAGTRHLEAIVEEIAHRVLCPQHKAQIESVAEFWRQCAWKKGWIMEVFSNKNDVEIL